MKKKTWLMTGWLIFVLFFILMACIQIFYVYVKPQGWEKVVDAPANRYIYQLLLGLLFLYVYRLVKRSKAKE